MPAELIRIYNKNKSLFYLDLITFEYFFITSTNTASRLKSVYPD